MTAPPCCEKKQVTATIVYSSPTGCRYSPGTGSHGVNETVSCSFAFRWRSPTATATA
jgi:hypothetical protein